jgi:hypothetical protein
VLAIPAKLQEKLRTSEVSASYDSVMRIARTNDPEFQNELIDSVLKGESNREIRSRLAERKAPVSRGVGEGKAITTGPQLVTLSENYEGCTATIRGPEGREARRHMRTALKRLLKQL